MRNYLSRLFNRLTQSNTDSIQYQQSIFLTLTATSYPPIIVYLYRLV